MVGPTSVHTIINNHFVVDWVLETSNCNAISSGAF